MPSVSETKVHPKGKNARVLLSSVFGPYAQDDELFSSNSSVDSTSHEFPLSLIPDPRLLASFLVSSHSSVDPREQTLCHSQPTENTRKMEMEAFAIW